MIPDAAIDRLKRLSKQNFKGQHYEGSITLQAVSWYLHYSLSCRDLEAAEPEPVSSLLPG